MNQYVKTLTNGFIKENPTFVLLLGMCPTLATTTSGKNGLMMGLATTFVFRNGVATSHPGFPPRPKQ